MSIDLRLLGCFRLSAEGQPIDVAPASARVLAYLGIKQGEAERSTVAHVLWPDAGRARSLGNLRSALWRLPAGCKSAVRERASCVALHPRVRCDVESLLDGLSTPIRYDEAVALGWSRELLPGWYDDWVVAERERFSLRRAGVFERLSALCGRAGLDTDAVLYAALAIATEPLRESAHQVLLRAHVAQGNLFEARRHFLHLEEVLAQELGVAPSEHSVAIVRHLDQPRRPRASVG